MASSAPDHLRTPGLISNRPCYEGIKLDSDSMGVPDEQITTVVDVSRYSKQKEQAALCHRTQIQGDDPFSWIPESVRTQFLSTEHLVRAEPPFASPQDAKEQDIVWGIQG